MTPTQSASNFPKFAKSYASDLAVSVTSDPLAFTLALGGAALAVATKPSIGVAGFCLAYSGLRTVSSLGNAVFAHGRMLTTPPNSAPPSE